MFSCCCKTRTRLIGSQDCVLCSDRHRYSQCHLFVRRKYLTTLSSYYDRRLRSVEEAGFLTAGILLQDSEGSVLMRGVRAEFISTSRETKRGLFSDRLETSFETATEAYQEEIDCCPPRKRPQGVFWFPDTSFVLYVIRATVISSSGRWFSREQLEQGMLDNIFSETVRLHVRMMLDSLW